MSFLITSPIPAVEQALDVSSESSIDESTLLSNASSIALIFTESPIDAAMDALYDALYSVDLISHVPPNFDDSTFPLEERLALATTSSDGRYMLPKDHLMHYSPSIVDGSEVRSWTSRPVPTTPYGMGLSFETSGWRAPAWRAPESREIEAACINPALLMIEPTPRRAAIIHDQDIDMPPSFEIPEAVPAEWEDEEGEGEAEEPNEDAVVPDLEEPPKRARAVRPLPRRVSLKASLSASPSRASRRSAPASSSTSSSPKKRKATDSAGPRVTKKAAITTSAPSTVSFELPDIPGVTDPGLPAPANSAGVSRTYWPLLRLGCTVEDDGISCNIGDCDHTTRNFGDMGRHVPAVHFRSHVERSCDGCPRTFGRRDAHKRHLLTKKKGHFSPARKAFLKTFNQTPSVIKMRAECPEAIESYMELNDTLYVFSMLRWVSFV
jgi:hypothetical protein